MMKKTKTKVMMNKKKKVYNKLIRDHMPEIIKSNGDTPITKIISGRNLKFALKNKLIEEAEEVAFSKTRKNLLEELADTYQALFDLTEECRFSINDLTKEVNRKFKEKGGFRNGVFLIEVT